MTLLTELALNFIRISILADKAAFIANNEFVHSQPTAVIWWHSDSHIVTNFLTNYHGSISTIEIRGDSTKNNSEFSDVVEYKQTVFFAADPEEYCYFLNNLNKTFVDPMRVLLVLTVPVKVTSYLEKYTKISLENSVSDVLIISTDSQDNIMLSTYMPYGPNRCNNFNPVVLNSNATDLFPKKFNNFYGCPIKVIIANAYPYIMTTDNSTDNLRGIDLDFFNIVMKKLNFSIIKSLKNMGGTKILKFVMNSSYDISLPGIVLNRMKFKTVQFTDVFKTLEGVLCGPNQREINTWIKVLLPFFTNITPFIVLSFLFFMMSVALTKRYGRYRENAPKGIIFGTLGLFLGQGIKFETKYWLNNWLFMLWIWYCTIVRIAYQGDLVDGLQKSYLEPHFKTGMQALEAVEVVGGPEGSLPSFRNSSPITKKIEIMLWKEIPRYIEEISKGKRFLLLTDISLIYLSPHKVQIVDEGLSNLPEAFFMRPRWGAAKDVNRIMVNLFEAGFVSKIVSDYKVHPQTETTSEGLKPLNMTTVASCFIGLVIMNLLCSVVLCVEILYFKFIEKKKLP